MILQNHTWIKDWFKVQNRTMDFSITPTWFRLNNVTKTNTSVNFWLSIKTKYLQYLIFRSTNFQVHCSFLAYEAQCRAKMYQVRCFPVLPSVDAGWVKTEKSSRIYTGFPERLTWPSAYMCANSTNFKKVLYQQILNYHHCFGVHFFRSTILKALSTTSQQ